MRISLPVPTLVMVQDELRRPRDAKVTDQLEADHRVPLDQRALVDRQRAGLAQHGFR